MTDRPILFSAPMVRALLAGTKTQTRRLIEPTDKPMAPGQILVMTGPRFGGTAYRFAPRVRAGDRLYVREHWRISNIWDATPPRDLPIRNTTIFCEAGGSIANQEYAGNWRPDAWPSLEEGFPDWVGKRRIAMHMPRWASRITLIVENVRVERLQDISEDDAIAEGVIDRGRRDGEPYSHCYMPGIPSIREEHDAVPIYAQLWEHINGEGAWAANPWVVAYTFRVVLGNIDMMEVKP